MSATREAIVLPVLFLTVALCGGLRIGVDVRLVPPPLGALVLAMLLVAALARSGVLVADVLMNAGRAPIENASGAVVLLALFAASAQIFTLLTPERGLLHALFVVFFGVQLLTTLAAVNGRRPMLRALAVLLGSAFVLRFIVLESVYGPGGGLLARMLTAALQGVTLGSFDYAANGPATGYVALGTVTAYVAGLVLLAPPTAQARAREEWVRLPPNVPVSLILVASLAIAGCGADEAAPEDAARTSAAKPAKTFDSAEVRAAALKSARVWREPDLPIGRADLKSNPRAADGFADDAHVACRLVLESVGGTTPKFNCELPGEDVVKIKYGTRNPEIFAEVAATRLLRTLGFGADRMYLVRSVRCAGCPPFPFVALKCLEETGARQPCFAGGLDYTQHADIQPAVIERRFEGDRIESRKDEGWAWFELESIDQASGGSPRADVDALRLLAVVLAHWDNKAENQRLVCVPGGRRADRSCAQPFLVVQDLGGTFGPTKLDLRNWRDSPVWADKRTCAVSMKHLPYGGATFPERRIGDEGRRKLLALLEQLSEAQLVDLFTASGVAGYDHLDAGARDARAWTAALLDKVRQIREAGPCP